MSKITSALTAVTGFVKARKVLFSVLAGTTALSLVAAVFVSGQLKKNSHMTPEYYRTDTGDFGDDIVIHHSGDGVVTIEPSSFSDKIQTRNGDGVDAATLDTAAVPLAAAPASLIADTDDLWKNDRTVSFGNFTMPEHARMANGTVGHLSIPKISLSVDVYENADELEAMEKGVAHFPHTSGWSGNIGLSAHNLTHSGNAQYFQNLHKLTVGDKVEYKTALGTRTYTVTDVWEVSDSDWSKLDRTEQNCITMLTCITSKPNMRLCVRAVETA